MDNVNKKNMIMYTHTEYNINNNTQDHGYLSNHHNQQRATFVLLSSVEHIGLVVRMSILDTKGCQLEPQHQIFFSFSKRLYPHCFSRLSCEMSTRWGKPREGCSVL